jgi:hypothetical protein
MDVGMIAAIGGALCGLATLLVCGVYLPYLFFRDDVKMHLGLPFWRRAAIRRKGQSAQANVLMSREQTGFTGYPRHLIVEVQRAGQAPYRAEVGEDFDDDVGDAARVGCTIPVYVDPVRPDIVVVDLAGLKRDAARIKKRQEQDEQERFAKMLRGD